MSSRRDGTALDQCLTQLKEVQKNLEEGRFHKNYIAIQQSLSELREDTEQIKNVQGKLEEIKKSRGHTKDFENADSELLLTQDLHIQKKRCFETQLYISEIENTFQNVLSDIEDRALYLSKRPKVFESVYRGEDLQSQSRMHKDCVYALRESWLWLKDVNRCMDIHINNAAFFHQFYHDAKHLEEDMLTFLQWLNSPTVRATVKTNDPEVLSAHFKLLTGRLLDYQTRVDRLTEKSREVHPIHYRKELPGWPVKARALVKYEHNKVSLEKDDFVTVLDISDGEHWMVRTSAGIEAEVAAIVLVIPPLDPNCFQETSRLRKQIYSLSETTAARLKSQLVQFLSIIISQTQTKEMQGLSAGQKSDFMKLANDVTELLHRSSLDDPENAKLRGDLTLFRKLISQIKPGQNDLNNATVQKWSKTQALVRQLFELETYGNCFYDESEKKRHEEILLITSVQKRYISNAYFQRVIPTVDIDPLTKESQLTGFKSELYIYERHRGKTSTRTEEQPMKKQVLQQDEAAMAGGDYVDGTTKSSYQTKTSEVKNFVIAGVSDPKTKQRLSISQAISKGILNKDFGTYNNLETGISVSIAEAIAKGLINVEYGDTMINGDIHNGVGDGAGMLNSMETKTFSISGVVDPRTGETIGVKEAIASGLLDPKTGKFHNPVTGEELSLLEAVGAGYLMADPSLLQDNSTDDPMYRSYTSIVLEDVKYKVSGVINPTTGAEMTLEQAIRAGIIDPQLGAYRNPKTGEVISIEEAMKRGLIKGRAFDPKKDKDDSNVLTVQQLQVKKQTFKAGEPGLVNGELIKPDQNEVLLDKLREKLNTAKIMVTDPKNGKPVSLEDAVEGGVIDLARGTFKTPTGESISLVEACSQGYIDPRLLEEILKIYQGATLGGLISSGQFDPETGLVEDLETGKTMALQAAIESKVIDPESTYLYDLVQNKVVSLKEAMESGRLDVKSAKIVDPKTGERLTIRQAEMKKLLCSEVIPEDIVERVESLSLLRGCMDTSMKGIRIPGVSEVVSVEEAITLGVVQVTKACYADEKGVGVVPLQLAVQMERVEPGVAVAIFSAFDEHSLEREIAKGLFDPKNGKYINPTSKQRVSVDEAKKLGVGNPDYTYLVDQESGNITTLGALMEKGKIDPSTGKYISDSDGQAVTISEAIAQGLIVPGIEPDKYVDTSSALKDLIDSGKVNPRSVDFVAANDFRMSLRDALANGFLTMGSRVKVDPESGDVFLASDEAIVQSLVELKESSDWLADIEKVLASQGRPSERLERLKQQADDCQGLKEEIKVKEQDVIAVINQAEQLVVDSAKNKGGKAEEKAKDETGQQLQKLKFSAADLKVRFDMVSTEAETRSTKLTTMSRNLEELYYHIEELDQWLDLVIEKTQDLQTSQLDIDAQYETLKGFVNDVKDKEDSMNAVVKSADSLKDVAQDIERDIDAFRKRLEILPTIREEGDVGVLNEELDSVEAKFKDISRECAKHMERLSSLKKQKKSFNELNDRLSQAYPALQERLTELVNEEFGKDPHKGSQDLDKLRAIKADLIGQERKLKDLVAVGERLASGLEDSDMNEEAEEVQLIIDQKQEEHRVLLEDVTDHEQILDAAIAEQQNVLGRLEGVEVVLAEAEAILEDNRDISLDKAKLTQQIQDQRLLKAKVGSTRSLLERFKQDAEGSREAEEKIATLLAHAESLEDQADNKTQEMENLLADITEFDAKSGELDGWLADSIKILKPKGGAPKPTRTKVDGLHVAKKEKEGEMEALRQMCEQLMAGNGVKDKFVAKETLADVETKWNDLTELLAQQVSLEALSEIDGMLKYLDKAENEINTAEPISIDPETLSVQLREHKSFDADLRSKRNAVRDIIDKCTRTLQETANLQSDTIKSRLESIKAQADIVCQLSAERLQQLEAAQPLATHYSENQTEISAWLDEMEAEMNAQGSPGENLEQVKKQHDNLKTTQQIIEDHELFIDDLNTTGMELMDLCAESDAVDLQNRLLDTNRRYEGLKSTARGKARDLVNAKRKFTQEAAEGLDHLLDDLDGLNRIVSTADPIPSSPDKLKNEIDENNAVLDDLDSHKGAVAKAEELAKNPKAFGVEDPIDVEDIKQKVAEIYDLNKGIYSAAQARDKSLNAALKLSKKFYDLSADVMSGLQDLKDGLYNQEPPGVLPDDVKEQQAELAGLKKNLEKARELVADCREIGSQLCSVCGDPGAVEVQKQLEDLTHMTEDVNDAIRDRGDELRKAFYHVDRFKKLLESISAWLPLSEQKLTQMRPPSSDPRTLYIQTEELRAFKGDVHPHIIEMQQLSQEMSSLLDISPVAAESLQRPVKQANEKWTELLRGLTDREAKLADMQLKVGEVSQAMSDIITALDASETELNSVDEVKGDPKFLETQLRKLQLMQSDIRNKEKTARRLNKAVDDILQQSGMDVNESPLFSTCQEMNQKIRSAQATAREKENKLQASMRQIKKFLADVDDQLAQVNDFRAELKTNQPFGALPDTAEKQHTDFVKRCQALDNQERPIESLLAAGQDLIEQCKPQDVIGVSERVKKLRERWMDTRDRARRRKDKIEEHRRNVGLFHDTLKSFTDWLNSAEISMRSFKYPSKLVKTVTKQKEEHEELRANLASQAEKMNLLDQTGTYLKHFGRKQDTIYVKNMLVGIRLRWKKLLRRADERGRLLDQAYREDKKFDDSWGGLCSWLDESMQTLSKFMSPASQSASMKQDIDELKKIELIRRFNHQLTAKHATFFSTTRLGRNLKDRCIKSDPERELLNDMLETLKNKWNAVRAVVSKSQNKLDEALLTSGRVSDALQSLVEWLQKAEAALDPEAPVLGDLDTVHMLLEQHRNIQQELAAREATVLTMRAPGNLPAPQAAELSNLWERVNQLSDLRENKLNEAFKLAEEFHDVVTEMREYLPQAEAQLKFRALPEDEMIILQFIEKHEKFQENLRKHQDSVDKIKSLAEEILSSCHPNAVRFVRYYLTITQTRWDQLLQRASNRGQRLQEALRNIQGNAALLEELLAWLTDAQSLLATKERDPIPDDLKVVETLLKEHLEFHDEVTSKNNDAERLSKLVTSESKMAAQSKGYGSNMKINEFDGYNPRVIALQNKWRTVWHMSVDRKKRLQDAHDTLLELESFKNFDFDLWRQRYLKWIQAKKFRITDFFRRQDKDNDGCLNREDFISGMLQSKFPTNRTELNAVFDIFDGHNRGLIEYKNFVDALKSDRKNRPKNKAKPDVELIHEEIEKELSTCQCRHAFRAEFIDEGKYRFGEKQKTCLVRFLNHTVMVRVGGGWVTLEEFVEQNDPCRAKGRTNIELRETLTAGYTIRRGSAGGRTSPFPTGVRRRQNDAGYASSNSSAGSNDSNLRRRSITTSMTNLASPSSNQSTPLGRSSDAFGSTGSLNRAKRLSNSSSNISGRKTPTLSSASSSSSGKRPNAYPPRSTTPSVGFGTSVRSRPTTPTFSPHAPPRPGSVTPTKGLSSTPPSQQSRHRMLPTTPKTPTTPTQGGFR